MVLPALELPEGTEVWVAVVQTHLEKEEHKESSSKGSTGHTFSPTVVEKIRE